MGKKKIKRRAHGQLIPAKDFWIADEILYIQARAADRDGRFVVVGSFALFSTETGDAWLLDPDGQLAARVARDGDPEEVYIEETDAKIAIEWKGTYQIQGDTFLYVDRLSNRQIAITGYPSDRIAKLNPLPE